MAKRDTSPESSVPGMILTSILVLSFPFLFISSFFHVYLLYFSLCRFLLYGVSNCRSNL
jgi:hypothetical protein